jgi:hypothetical protein
MTKSLLAKFRVYPRGRYHFFQVFVWKCRKDMHRALRKACVPTDNHCDGICCCNTTLHVKRNGHWRASGQLGQIHFHARCFSMGVITHESGHAALYWAEICKINPMHSDGSGWASKQQEAFCDVLGNIARQIVLNTEKQWKFPASSCREVEPYEIQ